MKRYTDYVTSKSVLNKNEVAKNQNTPAQCGNNEKKLLSNDIKVQSDGETTLTLNKITHADKIQTVQRQYNVRKSRHIIIITEN